MGFAVENVTLFLHNANMITKSIKKLFALTKHYHMSKKRVCMIDFML